MSTVGMSELLEEPQHVVHGGPVHHLLAARSGLDVAVEARLVAVLPHVDLEHLQLLLVQRAATRPDLVVEVYRNSLPGTGLPGSRRGKRQCCNWVSHGQDLQRIFLALVHGRSRRESPTLEGFGIAPNKPDERRQRGSSIERNSDVLVRHPGPERRDGKAAGLVSGNAGVRPLPRRSLHRGPREGGRRRTRPFQTDARRLPDADHGPRPVPAKHLSRHAPRLRHRPQGP